MTNQWAQDYQIGENIINQPTGKTVRPFPGGQQIGRGLPTQNNPWGAQANTKVVTLAQYDSANVSAPLSKTQVVIISTPSRRVACGLQIYFEFGTPVSGAPIPGITPLVGSVVQLAVNPQNGQTSTMKTVGSFNGPDSIALDPIYRDVQLVANIDTNNLDYTSMGISYARLMLIANWEPTVEISDAELNRLYGLCSVTNPNPVNV